MGKQGKGKSKKQGKRLNQQHGLQADDYAEMRGQLQKLGLTLKEIAGDGNCLFRALADQLYGSGQAQSGDQHLKLRRQVVAYMEQHRDDFEPFVADDVPFDRHLELLSRDGTYAGQDAIVAFARLHNVTVVIHQLNEPPWQIHAGATDVRCPRELHISYHNGDHYNSVRTIGSPSDQPTNIRIQPAPTTLPADDDPQPHDSSFIWASEGTGTRILGDQAAKEAGSHPARKNGGSRRRRHKMRSHNNNSSSTDDDVTLITNLQTLSL